jgi:hypothetical protein
MLWVDVSESTVSQSPGLSGRLASRPVTSTTSYE